MPDSAVPDERWLRIKALFASALEQPPDGLTAWLDEHCGGDGALAQELASLVSAHRAAGAFIETPAIESTGAARAVVDRLAPAVQAAFEGRRLGPYRIVGELARGGMGVVYLAERDDQAFRRQVAIKLMHGGVVYPALVARFEEERRILASLEHPNIARLLDAGTDEGGTPFVVMEYVEGTAIDRDVRERRLGIAERLQLFCAVCDAVQYSHQRLVVHRDIKPGNILVTREGVPKLLDFGIAKLVDQSSAMTETTRTEFRVLTPESASPEQMRGEPVTVATDVYSLGVLLYRLLTDRPPYMLKGRTDAEVMRAICEVDPPKPSDAVAESQAGDPGTGAALSAREAAARRRELSGDLDLITIKALRKEPDRRYPSVARFAEDIRRHLRGEPVEAAPESRRYRAGKFIRRHRAGLAAALAIALTIGAGLVATLWEARAAGIERERAVRRFNEVRALAQSLIFELHDAIRPLPGSTAARELLIRRALEYLDRIKAEPGADASLQRELAQAYIRIGDVQGDASQANLGQPMAALQSYRKALAIREGLARSAPSDRVARDDLARIHRSIGLVLSRTGDTNGALAELREAVSIHEELLASRPADPAFESALATSYQALGDALVPLEDWSQMLALRRKTLPLARHAAESAPDDLDRRRALAIACKRLGAIEAKLAHFAEGLQAYREALAIDEARLASNPASPEARMDVTFGMSDVGYILWRSGDARAALEQYDRVRLMRESLVGADPKDTRARLSLANTLSRMGAIRWSLGKREDALADQRSALGLLDAIAASAPTDTAVQGTLADVLGRLGAGYAQLDAGASNADACRRARPFLVRGIATYRGLAAKHPLAPESASTFADLEARLARCGNDGR
jgi:serine/threonine protein kinase